LALDGSPKYLFAALYTINYFSTFSGLKKKPARKQKWFE
jgi:hypothetical protein